MDDLGSVHSKSWTTEENYVANLKLANKILYFYWKKRKTLSYVVKINGLNVLNLNEVMVSYFYLPWSIIYLTKDLFGQLANLKHKQVIENYFTKSFYLYLQIINAF